MRLQISKTKNAQSLYIVKSTYDKDGKRSNKVVEKLGTYAELSKIHDDPIAWGKQRAVELTKMEELQKQHIVVEYNPGNHIEKNKETLFNGGYLFLQKLYYEYGIDKICRKISDKYRFEYDLNENNGLLQRYIVTYSLKYKDYLSQLREKQIQRAQKAIDTGAVSKKNANDPKRFVGQFYFTDSGEAAEECAYALKEDLIKSEEQYDGFYCVATNLEDDASAILKVNQRRWEIEESFRIMKSEFKARPVYLSRDDRIQAHFITCFLSLFIYRMLEKTLDEEYTTKEILSCLRGMMFYEIPREGYVPGYTRTDLTDTLHSKFGFCTDYEFMSLSEFRKIFKLTKKS